MQGKKSDIETKNGKELANSEINSLLIVGLVVCAENPHIEPLSWDIRLKIAIGAARGLTFLHTSDKKVIYRDFKASNILLDGVSLFIIIHIFSI